MTITTAARQTYVARHLREMSPAELIKVIARACDELEQRNIAKAVREHTGRIALECDDLETIVEAVNTAPAEITGRQAQGQHA